MFAWLGWRDQSDEFADDRREDLDKFYDEIAKCEEELKTCTDEERKSTLRGRIAINTRYAEIFRKLRKPPPRVTANPLLHK
jgi:hypothetical protein